MYLLLIYFRCPRCILSSIVVFSFSIFLWMCSCIFADGTLGTHGINKVELISWISDYNMVSLSLSSPLCPQQSGRSWASLARHRGSKVPVHNIYTHVSPTDNLSQFKTWQYGSGQQTQHNSYDDDNYINTERGHYRTTKRSGWWREACNSQ